MAHILTTKMVKVRNNPKVMVTSFLGSARYDWDYALSVEENHSLSAGHYLYEVNKERAGDRLWHIVAGGQLPDDGYGFVIDLK